MSARKPILAQEEGNVVFSPLSLYYALAILGEGASGETEEEILSALHSEDKNKLSDQCARLSGRYAYNKEYDRLWAKEYGEAEPEGSVNTLYFYGGRQEKFDASMTKEDIFRPLDGTEINKTIKM